MTIRVHKVKIEYSPGTLAIFFDDLEEPLIDIPVDVASTLELDNGKAWVGFTASSIGDVHEILSWSFNPVMVQ